MCLWRIIWTNNIKHFKQYPYCVPTMSCFRACKTLLLWQVVSCKRIGSPYPSKFDFFLQMNLDEWRDATTQASAAECLGKTQENQQAWGPINIYNYGCFRKLWYPQIIHFNRVFHYKPSILGYHYFWKHPYGLRWWYFFHCLPTWKFAEISSWSFLKGRLKLIATSQHCIRTMLLRPTNLPVDQVDLDDEKNWGTQPGSRMVKVFDPPPPEN